jgi:hypothetical protein
MTRRKVFAAVAIIATSAVLAAGAYSLYARYVRHSPGDRTRATVYPKPSGRVAGSPGGSTPPVGGRAQGFQPRTGIDTDGFFPLLSTIQRWDPGASLETIAESWRQPGLKAISKLDGPLVTARNAGDSTRIVNLLLFKAMMFNSEGQPSRAYEALEEARSLIEKEDLLARKWLGTILFFQGVVAMRRGENDNCIDCRGESSCILPISPAAVHINPTGSRMAIRHFRDYLERFPNDRGARWLLNLAHMTLGEHPDQVDPRFLISLDRFGDSEFDIGKFRDVGHRVGVNRFNQAGGAIMEDFDNDGRLDIAVTSMDPTMSMGYYRNTGDGTFEDRSKPAGVTGQLGGLVCYQTDYNNDGHMDIFIPRGAWLPVAVRPSLLRTTAMEPSPTSPRRPDSWTRSIPTRRPGAITTTTAGWTCSSAASGSPTACFTTGGTAPSKRSPPGPA